MGWLQPPSETGCPHCGRAFSSVSCLNRHYTSTIVCDRWRAEDIMTRLGRRQVDLSAIAEQRQADTRGLLFRPDSLIH